MIHSFRISPSLHLPCTVPVGKNKAWERLAQWGSFQIGAQQLPWEISQGAFAWGLCQKEQRRKWPEISSVSARPGFAFPVPFCMWNSSPNGFVFSFPLVFCCSKHCRVTGQNYTQWTRRHWVILHMSGEATPQEGSQPRVGGCGDFCLRYIMKSMSYKAVEKFPSWTYCKWLLYIEKPSPRWVLRLLL